MTPRSVGPDTVNEFHVGFIRNLNDIGQPQGRPGRHPRVAGIRDRPPARRASRSRRRNMRASRTSCFPSFVMGVPITNTNQWNNTLYLERQRFPRSSGTHTLKFGVEFHDDQVNENPNATFNGTFNILGTETGSAFADFLLGFPSNFTQSTGQPFYLRNRYAGLFAEDSWRARSDLTLNFGLRWDLIMPWSEKYNNIQTIVPGEQSVLYPNAIPGLVVPGDPGIPSHHLAIQVPQFRAAESASPIRPNSIAAFLKIIFGDGGKSSIRASYGMFYTAFPGISAGIMYAVPPFGYNYLSPAPAAFRHALHQRQRWRGQHESLSAHVPAAQLSRPRIRTPRSISPPPLPISADPYFYYRNNVPYTENYMLSFQRQITNTLLLTISYVGNQGHHILVLLPTNVGNQALCLSLSQPSEVAPGTATCGPFGEDALYQSAAGQIYDGTRNIGLGANPALYGNYGAVTAQETIGNSNYNALETNLRFAGKRTDRAARLHLLQVHRSGFESRRGTQSFQSRAHPRDFFLGYAPQFRRDLQIHGSVRSSLRPRECRLTQGWSISGTTRFSTGFPVTLYDVSDNSLLGTLGNGVNNQLLDTPQFTTGPLQINTNPRNGQPAFNTALFAPETLGQLGNARRRFFYGPGISNFDMQVTKNVALTEIKIARHSRRSFQRLQSRAILRPRGRQRRSQRSQFRTRSQRGRSAPHPARRQTLFLIRQANTQRQAARGFPRASPGGPPRSTARSGARWCPQFRRLRFSARGRRAGNAAHRTAR